MRLDLRCTSRGCCHASIYAHHTTPAQGTSTSDMKPPPRLAHETLGGDFYRTKRCTREKLPRGPMRMRHVSVCGLCLQRLERVIRMAAVKGASSARGGIPTRKPLLSARAPCASCASCMRAPWRLVHALASCASCMPCEAPHVAPRACPGGHLFRRTDAHPPLRTTPQSASCPLARLHSTRGLFRHSFVKLWARL